MRSRDPLRKPGPLSRALFFSTWLVIAALVTLATVLGGCASSGRVHSEYRKEILESDWARPADRTVVLFLIDGMSEAALQAALARGDLPNLERHFFTGPRGASYRAKTVFSSSTYPGIVSLLTTSPVSRHGVISNRLLSRGEELNFENVLSSRNPLHKFMGPSSVFARLAAQGYGSVNLSEPFRAGALVSYPRRIDDGLYYLNQNYSGIDFQVIESLEKLLDRTPKSDWPAFVFVHLIGLDALSHKYGLHSRLAGEYFRKLDHRLGPALARLRRAEAEGRNVVSFLTADHGFVDRTRVVRVSRALKRLAPDSRRIIEARTVQIHLPVATTSRQRATLLRGLARLDGTAVAAMRDGDAIYVATAGGRQIQRIDYAGGDCGPFPYQIRVGDVLQNNLPLFTGGFACPQEYDSFATLSAGAFAFASLADYFQAPTSPDVVVTAAANVAFNDDGPGNHGALTQAEMIVPLLTRNARIQRQGGLVANPQLLEFLFRP